MYVLRCAGRWVLASTRTSRSRLARAPRRDVAASSVCFSMSATSVCLRYKARGEGHGKDAEIGVFSSGAVVTAREPLFKTRGNGWASSRRACPASEASLDLLGVVIVLRGCLSLLALSNTRPVRGIDSTTPHSAQGHTIVSVESHHRGD